MFLHNVYFWLDDVSEDERHRFEDHLGALKGINLVQDGFVGTPADTDRDVVENSYDFHLQLTFQNKEDEEAYQDHPIHQEFINDCEELWTKVVVFDSVNES